jgi:ABC-type multidrug transport system ATPase subunit
VLASSTPDALWEAPSTRLLRPAAVACRDLRHGSGRRRLLDGVTLSVPVGARLLVVSNPEASASLLLRILAGLARPDDGEIRVAGLAGDAPDAWRQRVGYVERDPGIPTWLSPREALQVAARTYGFGAEGAERAIGGAASWAGIGGAELERPILRGGRVLLERVAFASALIGEPEVMLLDEPLRSLDFTRRAPMLAFPGRRRTVLLASRHPANDAGVCTHAAFLGAGRIKLITPISRLASEGLPLSVEGLETLATRSARR